MIIPFIICLVGMISCFLILLYDSLQDEKFYNSLDIAEKECYNDTNES